MQRSFTCPICLRKFREARGLNKHLGAVHGHAAAAQHGIRSEQDTETHADLHVDYLISKGQDR